MDQSLHQTEKALVIYERLKAAGSPILFHAFIIRGPKLEDLDYQRLYLLEDLKYVRNLKDLKLLSIELNFPSMYIALQNDDPALENKVDMLFLNCKYPVAATFSCDSDPLTFTVSRAKDHIGELIRDYSGEGGSQVYMLRGRETLEIDFDDKVVRISFKLMDFQLNNLDFTKKSAINGGFLYFVIYENEAIWICIANILNNFYIKEKLLDVGVLTPEEQDQIIVVFDENVYGGHRPDIFLSAPRVGKVMAHFTYDWVITFDFEKAIPDPVRPALKTLPVSLGLSTYNQRKDIKFVVNLITDPTAANYFEFQNDWELFRGSGHQTLRLTKESFLGDAVGITVKEDPNFLPEVEYLSPVDVLMTSKMPVIDGILYNEGGGYIFVVGKQIHVNLCKVTAVADTDQHDQMTCTEQFTYALQETESRVMSSMVFDNCTYLLLRRTTDVVVKLFENAKGTLLFTSIHHFNTDLAHLREFNNFVYFEALTFAQDEPVLKYAFTEIGELSFVDIRSFHNFYSRLNPVTTKALKKGSRKVNSMIIESLANERLTLYTIEYTLSNTVRVVHQTQPEIEGESFTCHFPNHVAIVDVTNNKMFTVNYNLNPPSTRRYPLAEYKIASIRKVECDYQNDLVLTHTNDGIHNRIIIFRVEENVVEAIRRVHTVINLEDRFDDELTPAGSMSFDSAVLFVFNQRQGKIHGYKYQVEVPMVTAFIGDKPASNVSTFDFEMKLLSSSSKQKIYNRSIQVRAVDQDLSVKAEVVEAPPQYLDGEIKLDNFMNIDGLCLTMEWINPMAVKPENVKFYPRVRRAEELEKNIPHFGDNKYDKRFITKSDVYIGWSSGASSPAHIYDLKLGYEVAFVTKSTGLEDCWFAGGTSKVIFCTKKLTNGNVQVLRLMKNESGQWNQDSNVLNYQVYRFEAFHIHDDMHALAMVDKRQELLTVYGINTTKSIRNGMKRDFPIFSSSHIFAFTTFRVDGRMVVMLNEGRSASLKLIELSFDIRFDSMKVVRQYKLDVFGGFKGSGFNTPLEIKCNSKFQEDGSVDVHCLAAHSGVYSYVSKLKFPKGGNLLNPDGFENDNDELPTIVFTKKIRNIQGYRIGSVNIHRHWGAILFERDTFSKVFAPTFTENYYLAIYKISENHQHPFAVIKSTEISAGDDPEKHININLKTAPNGDLVVTTYVLHKDGSFDLRKHVIGSFRAVFQDAKMLKTSKKEGILFKGLDQSQSEFITSRSLFMSYEYVPSWQAPLKLALIVVVVILSVLVVVFLVQSIRIFQKISQEQSEDGEEDSEEGEEYYKEAPTGSEQLKEESKTNNEL